MALNVGANRFAFLHKEQTTVYTVNYRFVIINGYDPSTAQIYSSGSTFSVNVSARRGASVTAEFNGISIPLVKTDTQNEADTVTTDDTFVNFSGQFTLPQDNLKDLALGKIKFSGTYKGHTERFESGIITCKKPDIIVDYDPNATPVGGQYINVGSGKITEIIVEQAETFDAFSTNDWSKPTNSYLPKGTVDYSAQSYVYYNKNGVQKEYAVLRCGKQVYTHFTDKPVPVKKEVQVVKEYAGTLPDHNEIGFASLAESGNQTVISFNSNWKAPFYFDLAP